MNIDTLFLAQRDFDDWIKIIVLILIFGGSALGAIIKKLIRHFTPKEPRESSLQEPRMTIESKRIGQPRRATPAHPIARPMPPAAPSQPTSSPHTARPLPSHRPAPQPPVRPTILPRPQPVAPAEVAIPPRSTESKLEPKHLPSPVEWLIPDHSEMREPSRKSPKKKSRRRKRKPAADRKEKSTPEQRLGHLESTIEQQATGTEETKVIDSIHQPTRSALRRAIIMSEILGPPIALRPPDDRY